MPQELPYPRCSKHSKRDFNHCNFYFATWLYSAKRPPSATMFGPILRSLEVLKSWRPSSSSKDRYVNFLTIHYAYIIGISILGSILVYPAGGMSYMDAVFMSASAATQCGLNVVDINGLNTYQQVVVYFLFMMGTPVVTHSSVVFVRLRWFEKRFENTVRLSRSRSRRLSRSRSHISSDLERSSRGVNGRTIVVLHSSNQPQRHRASRNECGKANKDTEKLRAPSERTITDEEGVKCPSSDASPLRSLSNHPNISNGLELEQAETLEAPPKMIAQQRSLNRHIAIENQRHPKDNMALRIPGPRENPRRSEENQNTSNELEIHNLDDIDMALQKTTLDEAPSSAARHRPWSRKSQDMRVSTSRERDTAPYLSWQPTVGRNSAFVGLTAEQKDELGGIEYCSLKTLSWVLIAYYFFFYLIAVIVLVPWIVRSTTWGPIVDSAGQSRVWWGIFTPGSMFTDCGYTLTPDSMISFRTATVPLVIGAVLIIAGQTGFPFMLRLFIWTIAKIVPENSGAWEELRFLLDHPRRCFTLLFPSTATWWLFWFSFVLNALGLIFFVVMDLNNDAVNAGLNGGYRVLDGLFQAISTRTAGFSVVNLANVHPALQVYYLVIMFIAVYPVAIGVRGTNVYEEQSLGIYGVKYQDEDKRKPSYVGAHIRNQLGFDLWYVFLVLFIVALAEGTKLRNADEQSVTMFACLFEIVSAYGTVGVSLGSPEINSSLSTKFGTLGKLAVVAAMIRGRHRALPYKLDRAIILPGDPVQRREDQIAGRVMQMRASVIERSLTF